MSETDKYIGNNESNIRSGTKQGKRSSADVGNFLDTMANPIGSVTSRDQIIDPYALVNPSNYKRTRAGQAQYNSDLAQAQRYAEMQEAAYQEWYESPEQQALRDREAGLNPDLLGLSDGEAADTEMNPNSPIAGQETNSQVASRVTDNIVGVISSVASLAALPGQFAQLPNIGKQGKLLDAQLAGQKLNNDAIALGNINAFEQVSHKAISDKFAAFHAAETAAGRAVDVASWFADDNNFADILPSYAPSDNPMYQNALARVRKGSQNILAEAYKSNEAAATNQSNFAKIISNPWYDDDTKIMSAQFAPIMDAIFELEKMTVDFNKKATDAKTKYVQAIDAEEAGLQFNRQLELENLIKGHQSVIEGAKRYVYENLKTIYETNPYSPAGFSASCMIMGHTPSGWSDFLTKYASSLLGNDQLTENPTENPYEMNSQPFGRPFGGRPNMRFLQEEAGRYTFVPYGLGLF